MREPTETIPERGKTRCAEKYFAQIGVTYLTVNPDKVGGW